MFVICYILCFCNIFFCVSAGKYIIEPSQQNAIEGFDFKLTCKVPGEISPPKRLAWTRNTLDVAYMSPSGEDTEIIDSKYTFHFKNERLYELTINGSDVMAENRSRWLCQDAAGGSHSQIYEMIVYDSPNVTVTKEMVPRNNSLILTCVADGNPKNFSFHGWKHIRNKSMVRSNKDFDWMSEDKSELVLKNITYRDNGEYLCSVDNGYRDKNGILLVREGHINVFVEDSPDMKIVTRYIKEKNSMDLNCVPTTSQDFYTVTEWTQVTNGTTVRSTEDFKSLTDNNRKLTLRDYTYSDSGVYTCFYNYRHIFDGQVQTFLEFKDTKYVRLRKKRQGNGSVYYDRMHQRIGLFNPLAELIEADLRRYAELREHQIKLIIQSFKCVHKPANNDDF
ncbi:hypothetical protein KUTeg_006382 [Tegillarca granosa]|uniref:Ig-like domain-containing protein n=1 Tax=Tegillarca granosa TaxID=220873 RepID=A0ABQ9FGC6_TEGGR|nr:hypothetical protein KUTeg_006382 [Tegillarca granosa]